MKEIEKHRFYQPLKEKTMGTLNKRVSARGFSDERDFWPEGSRGAAYFKTPWDVVSKLEQDYWNIPNTGALDFLTSYDAILQFLLIYDEEMAYRKGTYSRLVDLVMNHIENMPALYPQICSRLTYFAEDFKDSGDSDLDLLANELRTFLNKFHESKAESKEGTSVSNLDWAEDSDETCKSSLVTNNKTIEELNTESANILAEKSAQQQGATNDNEMNETALFQLLADEVFRDGVIDDWENKVLNRIGRFLRLDYEKARKICRTSKDRYKRGELGDAAPLNPRLLYNSALRLAYSGGIANFREESMLQGLRKLFSITPMEHDEMFKLAIGNTVVTSLSEISGPQYHDERMRSCASTIEESGEKEFRYTTSTKQNEFFAQYVNELPKYKSKTFEELLAAITDPVLVLRFIPNLRLLLRTVNDSSGNFWFWKERYGLIVRKILSTFSRLDRTWPLKTIKHKVNFGLAHLWLDLLHLVRYGRVEPISILFPLIEKLCNLFPELESVAEGATVVATIRTAVKCLSEEMKDCVLSAIESFEEQLHKSSAKNNSSFFPLAERMREEILLMARETTAKMGLCALLYDMNFESTKDVSAYCYLNLDYCERPFIVIRCLNGLAKLSEQLKLCHIDINVVFDSEETAHIVVEDVDADFKMVIDSPDLASVLPELNEQLNKTNGAYDVVLIDSSNIIKRIWFQAHDFDPSGRVVSAITMLNNDMVSKAQEEFTSIAKEYSYLVAPYIYLSLIEKDEGNFNKARKYLETALSIAPNHSNVLGRLGVLSKKEGKTEEARIWLERSLSTNSTDTSILGTLAALYLMNSNDYENGMARYMYYIQAMFAVRSNGVNFQELHRSLKNADLEGTMTHLGRLNPADVDCYC